LEAGRDSQPPVSPSAIRPNPDMEWIAFGEKGDAAADRNQDDSTERELDQSDLIETLMPIVNSRASEEFQELLDAQAMPSPEEMENFLQEHLGHTWARLEGLASSVNEDAERWEFIKATSPKSAPISSIQEEDAQQQQQQQQQQLLRAPPALLTCPTPTSPVKRACSRDLEADRMADQVA